MKQLLKINKSIKNRFSHTCFKNVVNKKYQKEIRL